MPRALNRLRWQLTLSHLVAIGVTLVSLIAAVLLIGSLWWARASGTSAQPVDDARVVASSIQSLILRDVRDSANVSTSAELSSTLRQLVTGDVRVFVGGQWPAEAARDRQLSSSLLDTVSYVVVVGADGRTLASSEAAGAAFAPAERDAWTPLVDAALSGTTDAARLMASPGREGPAAIGAYPVVDASGQPVAVVLAAERALPPSTTHLDFWHGLLFFGTATIAVLAGASIFALASSSLVSYLLARRLVRRLERLGQVAESFAAGDLTRRVPPREAAASGDEVGQLAMRFNAMADRLSESLAELAAEKQAVEAALRAKRELVANVSHELRTPLASIRGHTESLLLSGTSGEPAARGYLEVIHRQTEQLSRLIDDLFLLSTTESGALPLAPRPVDLGQVVQEVVRSIQPAAHAERQVSLVTRLDASLPPVLADRQRLAQVLANLIRNAVRHTPEGGLVAVSTAARDDRFAVVSVEDTGEGIPPDELEHVFERFYRVDPSRQRASGGAGLGLAIVRELVAAMGGEVSAESVLGEGSRFWFSIPLAETRPVRLQAPAVTGAHRRR